MLLYVFLVMCLLSGIKGFEPECETTSVALKTYYHWPVSINCRRDLVDDLYHDSFYAEDYLDYPTNESFIFLCTIYDETTGVVLLNTTFQPDESEPTPSEIYHISNVTRETPTNYKIKIQIVSLSLCMQQYINLDVIELPQQTCEQSMISRNTVKWQVPTGAVRKLLCDVPYDFDGPLNLVDLRSNDVKQYWMYNCGRKLPGNVKLLTEDSSLLLKNATYQENPGTYTCVVEYEGMTRYRTHHRLCVKEATSRSNMTVSCPNYRASIGDDVEMECIVNAGIGQDDKISYYAIFAKVNETGVKDKMEENSSCAVMAEKNSSRALDERYSCSLSLEFPKPICFDKPPSKEEITSQENILKMIYRIKNVQRSDFGKFKANIHRLNYNTSTIFTLSYDRLPGLERSTIIIIVCLSVLAGVGLFIFMVCVLCGLEMRWMWKHNFASKDGETKPYSAYLAYYYSKDMSETSPIQLEAFIMNLNTRLLRIGGEIYDKCRDLQSEQYIAENISAKLSECHRVIIILTPEYIRNQWSVFEAYEAWKNVIENGIPIIFITFPTTASAMQSLSMESRTALTSALKRHRVIEWKGILPFSRHFRMKLELFMPKLPRVRSAEGIHIPVIVKNGTMTVVKNGNSADMNVDDIQKMYENSV